ncbi:hypothetical protein GS429_03795 [Natronorubrum sp. JWXQ-INN-674]|uniref:PD-(D/E)XK nuclease family protein n=1 Tax=Natronorubrum halalkaliphilum TaxID=2691917 RepID=A0A6B0VJQ5_9EURY|nr:hypothetical protein [Natronorubrum halalkaliphilum]MXV61196.1 hypothetical protein [Natronorubrum halalkaliphilum]
MGSELVRFESVCTRDIDTLVLEELSVSPAFRSWLLEPLSLSVESATMSGAWYSAVDGEPANRERTRRRTDVELGLEIGGEQVLVVLASTIGSPDSPFLSDGSLERYRTRRERALANEWDDCRTILIAPAETIAADTDVETPAFDATVSLESIREWFDGRETDRGDYRATLVAAAIDHSGPETDSRGAVGERVPTIVRQYRAAVSDRDPTLELTADPDLAGSSDETGAETRYAVAVDAPSLASDHRLVHELKRGAVDLRIPGAADHLESFAARYAAVLSPATKLLTAGDALVLRRSVPAIEPDSPDAGAGGSESGADAATSAGETGSRSESTSADGREAGITNGDFRAQNAETVEAALEAVRDLLEISERIQD